MKKQAQKSASVCVCCGFSFDENVVVKHIDVNTKELTDICEWCWKQDSLYFPDKPIKSNMMIPPSSTTKLREKFGSKETIEINVLF